MNNEFSRTQLLLGQAAMDRLAGASVAIFGIGGVGSYVAEALARSGVGHLAFYDNDQVSLTNINRQLIATHRTIGMAKTQVMRERALEINPAAQVQAHELFYGADTAHLVELAGFDYVVDAIDTVTSKLLLIERCREAGVAIISSMGAGNKLDPTQFQVADIYSTSVCPLAKAMRHELRKRGIPALKVVYSQEMALTPLEAAEDKPAGRRAIPGSVAFVPSVAGLILAGEVIKDLVTQA